jgi:acyl-CoA reductase-like NAD-dependent aldehyde dehydrogenase
MQDAVNRAVSGIFAATGQTCIAGSRLVLQDSIHDRFLEKHLALARTVRMGGPMSAEVLVCPITIHL